MSSLAVPISSGPWTFLLYRRQAHGFAERDKEWFRLFISGVFYFQKAVEYALLTDLFLGICVNGTLTVCALFL